MKSHVSLGFQVNMACCLGLNQSITNLDFIYLKLDEGSLSRDNLSCRPGL